MSLQGSYAVVATVQNDLINMAGDAPTTTWLTDHKPEIDNEIDDTFRPYIDLIPFITGATNDLIAIANYRLAALWFATNKDFNSQKYWDKRADTLTDKVIVNAKAQSNQNTRVQKIIISNDPRNAKVPLPSQVGIYAFDDFA